MGIREVEDVLSPDDMVVIFEAAVIALRTKDTLDKIVDHLDISDDQLASLEAKINFVLYGGD